MELMVAVTVNLEMMMEEGVEEGTEERTEERTEEEMEDEEGRKINMNTPYLLLPVKKNLPHILVSELGRNHKSIGRFHPI